MTDGDRTRDNRNHNPALYQLSYGHHEAALARNHTGQRIPWPPNLRKGKRLLAVRPPLRARRRSRYEHAQLRGVAQPGSARALGARCRGFKSLLPDRLARVGAQALWGAGFGVGRASGLAPRMLAPAVQIRGERDEEDGRGPGSGARRTGGPGSGGPGSGGAQDGRTGIGRTGIGGAQDGRTGIGRTGIGGHGDGVAPEIGQRAGRATGGPGDGQVVATGGPGDVEIGRRGGSGDGRVGRHGGSGDGPVGRRGACGRASWRGNGGRCGRRRGPRGGGRCWGEVAARGRWPRASGSRRR